MLYVKTFGGFELADDGRRIMLARSKDKALLAYLCVNEGCTYTREHLADLLWEDSAVARAKHSLSQSLYSIKRLLPNLIVIQGDTIKCDPSLVTTDAKEAKDCATRGDVLGALKSVAGPFLSDLTIPGCSGFEDWRSGVNRRFFSAFDELIRQALDDEVIDAARATLNLSPHLMDLLPSLSRIASARKTTSSSALLSPKEQLRVSNNSGHPVVTISPFGGRTEQLSKLQAAFDQVKTGQTKCVVITGLAGHGKTRLADEFLNRIADSQTTIIRLRCYESERRIGFGPIIDGLQKSITPADIAQLEPVWRAALAEFIPSLHPNGDHLPQLSATDSQARIFEAILRLLADMSASRPVVMFLDDAQWIDKSSRTLFSYLTHRLDNAQVLLIAAHRTKSIDQTMRLPWGEWIKIFVRELDDDDVCGIITELQRRTTRTLPPVEQVRRLTGGHPYLLSELVRSVMSGASADLVGWQAASVVENVRTFVIGMLRSVPREAQQVVAILAVLGRPTRTTILRRLIRPRAMHQSVDILISRGIAIEDNGHIALRHDLVREVAYRCIPLFTRAALHRRVANELSKTPQRAGEAAEQYHRAGMRQLAYKSAMEAMRRADATYAYDEAISYLRLAIKTCGQDTCALRCELAERLHRLHLFAEARHEVDHLLTASKLNGRNLIPIRLLDLELTYSSGKLDRAALRRLLDEIKSTPDATGYLNRALDLEMKSVYQTANREAMLNCIRELRDFAGKLETAESLEALAFAARLKSLVDSSVEAERWTMPVLAAARSIVDQERRIRVMSVLGAVTYEVGKLEKAEVLHRELLQHIEQIGAIKAWPLAATHLHMILVEQGRFNEAVALGTRIQSRAEIRDAVHQRAVWGGNTATMLYEMGQYGLAEDTIQQATLHAEQVDAVFMKLEFYGLQGLIAMEMGKLLQAASCAEQGRDFLSRLGFRAADVSYLEILISRIDTLNNRRTDAILRLREAVDDYRERDVVCRLRIQLELAALLRKAGNINEARTQAKTVFHTASAIKARPIAEKADSLLTRM
jgi:tetratricopeptide (TPR) repeat protein